MAAFSYGHGICQLVIATALCEHGGEGKGDYQRGQSNRDLKFVMASLKLIIAFGI